MGGGEGGRGAGHEAGQEAAAGVLLGLGQGPQRLVEPVAKGETWTGTTSWRDRHLRGPRQPQAVTVCPLLEQGLSLRRHRGGCQACSSVSLTSVLRTPPRWAVKVSRSAPGLCPPQPAAPCTQS